MSDGRTEHQLVFKNETINRAIQGRDISKAEALDLYQNCLFDSSELFLAASILRHNTKSDIVSYSRKAFFNIINLCRDTCSYCTYKAEPGQEKLSLLSKEQINNLAELAIGHRCTEALLVTGERPEQRYDEAKKWLKSLGFSSTPEYLIHVSEMLLEKGLFPHTNAGNLTKAELSDIGKTNASIGIMLENTSERLSEEIMPHNLAPSKHPKARINVLENSGTLKIPTTTGLLIGIGETTEEIIDSLLTIKDIQKRHGHIQEIILQNFQPKEGTAMGNYSPADFDYFRAMVALSRLIMPRMNIQIPPNLSPQYYARFLSAGINDWGGISPLTPDYVNPEFPWPDIAQVYENSSKAGYRLKARLPVYNEFLYMVNDNIRKRANEITDNDGFVREDYING